MMRICWKESRRKQRSANSYSYLQSLSDDIHRIILSFYAKDWKNLIKFGSVCRSFKMVADHSTAWILLPKEFYTSEVYFRSQTRHLSRYQNQNHDYRTACDSKSRILFLSSEKGKETTPEFISGKFKIIVQIDFEAMENQPLNILHQGSAPILDYELAFKVRQQFMKIFVGYHRLWAWYAKWIQLFDPIRRFDKYTQKSSFRHAGYGYYIFLLLAIILLADLPNLDDSSSSSFSVRDYFGFACVYILALVLFYVLFLHFVYSFLYELNFPHDKKLRRGFNCRNFSGLPPILYSLGILSSLILLQYKLVTNDENISIAFLSIPFSASAVITFLFLVVFEFTIRPTRNEAIKASFLFLIFIFAMPVSYLLVTLYYDDPRNIYSESVISSNADHPGLLLWCTTIPIIPFEFLLCSFMLNCYQGSFCVWRDYLQGKLIVNPTGNAEDYCIDRRSLRLIANAGKSLSATIMVGLIIYFNILIGMNTIRLSQVFVISLSIAFSLLMTKVAEQFDRFYL